jgi:hypothetical protein
MNPEQNIWNTSQYQNVAYYTTPTAWGTVPPERRVLARSADEAAYLKVQYATQNTLPLEFLLAISY